MIDIEVARLPDLSVKELKDLWVEYFKCEATSLNKKFYVYRLAYRMQELAYGGMPSDLKKMLVAQKLPKKEKRLHGIPPIGTTLIKSYRDREYSIKILPDNFFEFEGRKYKSLSAIARTITGQKISGTLFWGLSRRTD